MEVWRVNLAEQSLKREPIPEGWSRLGGRGLSARILLDEVPPACEPLGRHNKLIFAPGLLTGHVLTSCDRLSIGAKSPLTRGIKEANAGGSTAPHMTSLGIWALILEGQCPENGGAKSGRWILHLSVGGARFEPADDLAGLGVYAAAGKLIARYGKKVGIALIGPGGEMGLSAAGITNLDKDHVPSRYSARGGLGAVMGAKRLKAIVFDSAGGTRPPLADPEAFKTAQKKFTKNTMDHPQSQTFKDYGTPAMTRMTNAFGGLPTRNFSSGSFEGAETIGGEFLREVILKRGGEGEPSHACMAGCVIQCSNVYAGEDGKAIVAPLEYETIGLMGSNLGLANLDDIARLNWEANDLGIDTIEIGAALGVAAEAGLMKFGDGARALELMGEIRQGTPLGRTLGHGAAVTGRIFGVLRVPAVKGQSMAAYEPRGIKGLGATYATSPMGADHTAGNTVRAKVDHLDAKACIPISRGAQINSAGFDTLGACLFSGFGFLAAPEVISELLNARYGWQVGTDILQVLGRETLKIEREFNRRAGFSAADDRIPEYMRTEPLPPNNSVYDAMDEDLDGMFNF
jgi:aldehyde:ferredoxin oxidoreductase